MKVDKNRYFVMGVKNIKTVYQILGRGCFVGEGGRKMCSFQSKINVTFGTKKQLTHVLGYFFRSRIKMKSRPFTNEQIFFTYKPNTFPLKTTIFITY